MDKTKVKVEFCLYGDLFDPGLITKSLMIEPTCTYIKGEHIRGELYRRNSNWVLSTEYEESDDIKDQLLKIINLIRDKKTIINEMQNTYSLSCKFFVVIQIENNEKPAIYLDRETIRLMYEINVEIDFDYYIYS